MVFIKKESVTIQDVASEAGVAVGTVSRYLNGFKVKKDNRNLIESAISKLNYKTNIIARSLKTKKSYTIGLLFPSVIDPFATEIMDAVEEVLYKKNYSVMIVGSRNSIDIEKERIEFFNNKRIDGLIIMPISDESYKNIELLDSNIPVVIIDKKLENDDMTYITCNNRQGSYLGVSNLIENGHKRIAIVAGPTDVYTSKQRKQGYIDALVKHNISVDDNLIRHGLYQKGGGVDDIEYFMKMSNPPTAIFTTNFEITKSAIKYFMKNKISIGNDISLLGYDNIDVFQMLTPKIETIAQPMFQIGSKAAELILEKIGSDSLVQSVELDTCIVKGESIKNNKG
ncbi:MAG: LacI family DNA-binding transcriptional regulator [Anaerorhabdus sp.]